MSPTSRKWMLRFLRLAVCAAALTWVLYNVSYFDHVVLTDGSLPRLETINAHGATVIASNGSPQLIPNDRIATGANGERDVRIGIRTTVRNADKSLLAACLVIFAPATLLQSLRFLFLLRAQEIRLRYWESVKLCYAGNFLNFVTALGSTGGDVFKMYYVSLHTERKTEAATTVILDRIVGLFGLVLVASTVIAFRIGDRKLTSLATAMAMLVVGSLLAAACLYSPHVRRWIGSSWIVGRLPFAEHIRRALAATRRLANHKRLVAGAFICTVLLQMAAISAYVTAAAALGMNMGDGKVWEYYAYFAGGSVVAAIPISFQGLGTMEAYYKHVFLGTHGTLPALLCLAILVRGINLCWALPGVIVTMTGSYRPRVSEKKVPFAGTALKS